MTVPNHKDPIYKALLSAKVQLLLSNSFFGNMVSRMKIIDGTKWCESFTTDGLNVYFNRDFVKKLTKEELIFVFGHIVLHAIYDHLGRRGSRNTEIWDMAIDYRVNYDLEKGKIGTRLKNALYSDKYDDSMTADQIYKELKEKNVTIQMPMDEHIEGLGKGKHGETITVSVQGSEDGPPQLSDGDMEAIRNEIIANMIDAASTCDAGKVPLGVRMLIKDLTEPKMNWKEMLEMHIKSAVKSDFTFNRISKRSWSMYNGGMPRFLLPSQDVQDAVEVFCAADASGSMSDEQLREIFSEVKGIMQTFSDFKLWLCTFDTAVYNPRLFTPYNIDEIDTYELGGRGGTMFECVWEFMKNPSTCREIAEPQDFAEPIVPHKMVLFTDGCPCSTWGDPEYCDTLFVIHGNTSIKPAFGSHAYYDLADH